MTNTHWPRAIAHVDLDAFFASVEVLDRPQLRGQPVLVGGQGRRAVVATANYEARSFGCHSAQPMSQALARCPHAVVCAPRFERYSELSRGFFSVLSSFSPLVEALSIDEGFVDLSGTQRLLGPVGQQPQRIMDLVKSKLGLTCSVGLAPNKFLAKMASEINKPAGSFVIEPGQERGFLDPLDVSRLWGVGKKTVIALHQLGLKRVGDIAQRSRHFMGEELGALGLHLHALSRGEDLREVQTSSERKQIGIERTFERDLRDPQEVHHRLLSYASELADRLVAKDLRARKVQIKLRRPDFKTITRQSTLPIPTFDAPTLFAAGWSLYLASNWSGTALRLLGLSVGELCGMNEGHTGSTQLSLLPEAAPEQEDREQAEARQRLVSEIREKFGGKGLYLGDAGEVKKQ